MPNYVTAERKILTTLYSIIHLEGTLIVATIGPGIQPISFAKSARALIHSTLTLSPLTTAWANSDEQGPLNPDNIHNILLQPANSLY